MFTNDESKSKRFLILGVCFIIVILVTVLLYFGYFSDKKEDLKDNYNTSDIIEFTFEEDGKEYSVVNVSENKYRWLAINGERASILSVLPTQPTPHLALPKTRKSTNIEGTDKAKQLDDFTYEATLEQSAEYLNYLIKQDYTIERQVQARNYIEVILSNNTDTRKRIIVQERLLMVGEVDKTTSLPKLEDYLSSYKITGGELNE